jgi:hypothetical protein
MTNMDQSSVLLYYITSPNVNTCSQTQESVLNVSSLLGWLVKQPAGWDLNQFVTA